MEEEEEGLIHSKCSERDGWTLSASVQEEEEMRGGGGAIRVY